MARPTNPDIKEPKDPAKAGDTEPKSFANATTPEELEEKANIEGWTGKDGSKSLGYLAQPPHADSSGLATDADDAGRNPPQEPGQNSGAQPGPSTGAGERKPQR